MSSEAPKKRGRKPGSTNKPTGPVGSRASSVRRNVTLDDYPAIQVEGGLFTVEHVRKVAKTGADKQTPTDYDLPAGIDLKEEIGRSFRIATALWKEFDSARQGEGDKSQATVRFVSQLLKDCFGFADIKPTEPKVIAEIPYPIGRTAHGKVVPVLIVGAHQGLDVADLALGDGHRKRTASQLTQEYLNAEDACLWAVCTNGLVIRLLRDSDSLTRQSYFEANIERILGEQLLADFAMLWLHAHASRLKPDATGPVGCPLEIWHLAAQEEGSRVRDSLRIGVEKAMVELGSGFLEHRDGARLREALRAGTLKLEEYHQQVLRLVYRMLFLFAVEDRKILHPRTAKTEQVELYAEGYSLSRLRERSIKHCHDRYDDIWDSLKVTFKGLATGQEALGLPPLGSLFAEEQCAELVKSNISNRRLLNAVRAIAWFRENDALVPVNYKSMGTEELGSVYESLLELTPAIDESGKGFGFIKADEEEGKGNSRKTSGSYYTPDSLVQQLLDTTLDPVVADRLKGKSTKEDKEKAILSVTVIDPACGSGHFLLGAARRLAEKLASIRAEGGEATDYRRALRDVIASCIHGVDRNPMAIQLAKVALWLEGYVADKPLSFLDHHLVVGDSILSIIDLDMATKGIPDEAYEVITGDDKAVARALKARNKTARDSELKVKQATMDLFGGTKVDMGKSFAKIDVLSDDTLDGVAKKVGQLEIFMKEAQADWRVTAAKLYLGAYLLPKVQGVRVPTSADILAAMNGENIKEVMSVVDAACSKARVLIWPLAFPHVFGMGGFDVVLGNPPWERLTLKEKEFFAVRSPRVAQAANKAERQREMELLQEASVGTAGHAIYEEFLNSKRESEVSQSYAHDILRYPHTGLGDVNLYALFAESMVLIINPNGRAGIITPTGIATDESTSPFFNQLLRSNRLVSLFDFENKYELFKGVDRRTKFALSTIGASTEPEFAFYLYDVSELKDSLRRFTLSPADFELLNPNTRTCPAFRAASDADLARRIYKSSQILVKDLGDDQEENPWGIVIRQGLFHLTNDINAGVIGDLEVGYSKKEDDIVVYEGKNIHQYDHRWATYIAAGENGEKAETKEVLESEKRNKSFEIRSRYLVGPVDLMKANSVFPDDFIEAGAVGGQFACASAIASFMLGHDAISEFDVKSQSRGLTDKCGGILAALSTRSDWRTEAIVTKSTRYKSFDADDLAIMKASSNPKEALSTLIKKRLPMWHIGWRDITSATNERTMVASIIPYSGPSYTLRVITKIDASPRQQAALLANLNSIVLDYLARQSMNGSHLSDYIVKQLPILPPDRYSIRDLDFITSRVLELTYTSSSLKEWAAALGHEGHEFTYNSESRAVIAAELDAYFCHLYGLSRADLVYILDPKEAFGTKHPSETFRGLKNNELKEFGEYRTQRLVLEAWDRIVEPLRRGQV